ncbi:MAG: hypothetical protein J6Z47_01935, partial [Bacteroidales bacterium]|nr:hypothetical protein [Bacteroidales bacterium]
MKKYLLVVSLVLLAIAPARAQKGLQTDSLFSKAVPISGYEESLVKGAPLRDYNLTYFRSVRFPADKVLLKQVSSWIKEDAETATSKDIQEEDGGLVYALLQFDGDKSKKRYLGYQVRRSDGKDYVTV